MDNMSKPTTTDKATELHPEAWKLRAAEVLPDAALADRVTAIETAIDTVAQATKATDEGKGALWTAVRMVAESAQADKLATTPADKASLFLAILTERIEPKLREVAEGRKLKFAEYAKSYTETKSRAKAAMLAGVDVTGKTLNAVKSELPKRAPSGAAAGDKASVTDMGLAHLGPKCTSGIAALRTLFDEVLTAYPLTDTSAAAVRARGSAGDLIGAALVDFVAQTRADLWPEKYAAAEAAANAKVAKRK